MKESTRQLDFSTVLASSAHDIKNSLAILLGSLSEIDSNCLKEIGPCRELLLRAKQEGDRVNRDLIQLLTLYRIEQSNYCLNQTEVVIADFLDDILMEHQDLLASHDITLEIENKVTDHAYFDEALVGGIINTVIGNAHRYTENRIRIDASLGDGYLVLSVMDNGPGYPKPLLQSGKKEQQQINFGTGSTGLGFYFASHVAALHKNKGRTGYIQISNDGINQGGRFSLYLP
jgi:signal transduction histidine kinase